MGLLESALGKSSDGPLARVRYTEFTPKRQKQEYAWKAPTPNRRKSVQAPSGHVYQFRQTGHSKSETSQWLPIHADRKKDLDFFEMLEGYEVDRS